MKYSNSFMKTAEIWSKESYCKRRQVGAVLAKNSRIISTGFNGTISGLPNQCEELVEFKNEVEMNSYDKNFIVECESCCGRGTSLPKTQPYIKLNTERCKACNGLGHLKNTYITSPFTLHAEYNAIIWAQKEGKNLEGATMYVTLSPCAECAKLIAAVGIKEVIYKERYKDTTGLAFLESCDVTHSLIH